MSDNQNSVAPVMETEQVNVDDAVTQESPFSTNLEVQNSADLVEDLGLVTSAGMASAGMTTEINQSGDIKTKDSRRRALLKWNPVTRVWNHFKRPGSSATPSPREQTAEPALEQAAVAVNNRNEEEQQVEQVEQVQQETPTNSAPVIIDHTHLKLNHIMLSDGTEVRLEPGTAFKKSRDKASRDKASRDSRSPRR